MNIIRKQSSKPAIKGRNAVRHFADHFCSHWNDAKITFHEAVTKSGNAGLVWNFRTRNIDSLQPGVPPNERQESWTALNLFVSNEASKIEDEIDEGSEPPPIEHIMQDH